MNLHNDIRRHLLNLLDRPADETQLNQALRLLSKWRSVLIRNRLLLQQGTVVMEGVLEGLDFHGLCRGTPYREAARLL